MRDAPASHDGDKRSIRAVRDELVGSIERWRAELGGSGSEPSTLLIGVALRAVTLSAAMVSMAITTLAPDAPIPPRSTLGMLVGTLVSEGTKQRATCMGSQRNLLRPGEIRLLQRLSRLRASIAHQEDVGVLWEAAKIGRLGVADVAEFLDVASQLCRLPFIDELICRESQAAA